MSDECSRERHEPCQLKDQMAYQTTRDHVEIYQNIDGRYGLGTINHDTVMEFAVLLDAQVHTIEAFLD